MHLSRCHFATPTLETTYSSSSSSSEEEEKLRLAGPTSKPSTLQRISSTLLYNRRELWWRLSIGPQLRVITLSGRVSCGFWASRGKLTLVGTGWSPGDPAWTRLTEGTPRTVGAVTGASSDASPRVPEQHPNHSERSGISTFGISKAGIPSPPLSGGGAVAG